MMQNWQQALRIDYFQINYRDGQMRRIIKSAGFVQQSVFICTFSSLSGLLCSEEVLV